jgi:transaldolase
VLEAHQRALENRLVQGLGADGPSSVASFFLSRIDVEVDRGLNDVAGADREKAQALKGQAAIANAKLAYQMFRSIVDSHAWQKLAARGARVQRVLWASTGTKDEGDRDVKYIEPLIGPQTVSTMPYRTAQAFADHGRVARTVDADAEEAVRTLQRLADIGIDMQDVATRLLEEGLDKFRKPYNALLDRIEERRREVTDEARVRRR